MVLKRLAMGFAIGTGAWLTAQKVLRSRRRFDLLDRVALVTGGSRGLGLAIARVLAGRGAKVALCARDADELSKAAEDIRSRGGRVWTFPVDLRQPSQITDLIELVESTVGSIDLLVNNAAAIMVGPAQQMTADDFKSVMDLNFWAAVNATLAVVPGMRSRGFGRIVNIASLGGKTPVPHLAPYCASKFALVGFSSTLRTELANDGILVTTVSPGLMKTGSPGHALFKGKHSAEHAWFSIGDNLPGLSMPAMIAARRIVQAAVQGDAELVLGLPAKLGALSYGLFPNIHSELITLVDQALPGPSADNRTQTGKQSESKLTRAALNILGDGVERDLNQAAS